MFNIVLIHHIYFLTRECGICCAELSRRLEGHLKGRCGGLSVRVIRYKLSGVLDTLKVETPNLSTGY